MVRTRERAPLFRGCFFDGARWGGDGDRRRLGLGIAAGSTRAPRFTVAAKPLTTTE
ncbi:MAG: hypothetical protein KIT31_13860 [Deltaproteobacteria bacterium]|nr:hypothetical protein [Deltaproteobacteria bacterium]